MLNVFVYLYSLAALGRALVNDLEFSTVNLTRKGIHTGSVPEYFDWRDKGVVSPVKDQARCAACWAFSTVASIESHLMIYLEEKYILSEQFLIDCDENSKGCTDSSILETFGNIVSKYGGVLKDKDYYPYEEKKDQCRWDMPSTKSLGSTVRNSHAKPIPVVGYRRVLPDEDSMVKSLYQHGPLVAGINSASMGKYSGNFIDEPTDEVCNPEQRDHAVLIVGYNVYVDPKTGRGVPYWVIKNSWGVNWGDNGFYYLVRGRNACGIANDVSFPYVN